MALDTKEVRSTLNGLIEICKDGEEGFRKASASVKTSSLQTLFNEFSSQRSKFAGELQVLVAKLGGEPEKSGSVSAAAHRGWIGLKSMVTGENDQAVIAECERGEDVAKKAYQEALEKDLPSDIRSVVEHQHKHVLEAHDRVRSLENKTKSSGSY